MPAITSIIAAVAAAGALAGGVKGFMNNKPNTIDTQPTASPVDPNADKSASDIAAMRGSSVGEAPGFLKLSAGMTPLQKRAAIAAGATNSSSGVYTDPATKQYYKELALSTQGEFLPIEKQYAENVLGQKVNTGTPESFYSALMRS